MKEEAAPHNSSPGTCSDQQLQASLLSLHPDAAMLVLELLHLRGVALWNYTEAGCCGLKALSSNPPCQAVMWSRRGLNGQCFCRRGVPRREMQARLQITYGHPRARPRPEGSGVCPGFSLLDGR